jgi:hypothetical protein
MTTPHRWFAVAAALALTVGGVHTGTGGVPRASAEPVPAALAGLLDRVPVVDRIGAVPGYQRGCRKDQSCVFGPAWNDPTDHSGCDTRNRVLRAALKNVVFKPGTRDCKVTAGTLDPDPYTGQAVDVKQVQIDHRYALRRAWDAGASQWTPQQRQIFANDLTELVAVSATANRAKSDYGLDQWLPEYQPCGFVVDYLTVAAKYQLPITTAERAAAVGACQNG